VGLQAATTGVLEEIRLRLFVHFRGRMVVLFLAGCGKTEDDCAERQSRYARN
jgi:hypothetical protein